MQVAMGRRGDYSVRAVLDLARHYEGGRRKARQIAVNKDIPRQYLPQILAPLVRAGLIDAFAGPDGGYRLSREPSKVNLLEVVEAAEGPVASGQCVLRGGPCDRHNQCPLHESWLAAQEALCAKLREVDFAELASADRILEERSAISALDIVSPVPPRRRNRRVPQR